MASAPPNGSVLATSEPARLTVSARVWVIPGSAPVMVKVKAIRALSCSAASSASAPGCSPRNGSRISVQPTPATFGRPQTSRTTASAMRDHVADDPPPHLARVATRARATSSCTWPACHGTGGHWTIWLTSASLRSISAVLPYRWRPTTSSRVTSRSSAGAGDRFAGRLSGTAVTVIDVPPSTTTATATASGRGADDRSAGKLPADPESSHWLRRLFGYCWRHPTDHAAGRAVRGRRRRPRCVDSAADPGRRG